ncbi:MAG: hypothetical protein WDZ41_05395 [Candidatus Babeliales bacterium]
MHKCFHLIFSIFLISQIYSLNAVPKQSPEIISNFIKDLRYNTALTAKIGYGICALSSSFLTSILVIDKLSTSNTFSGVLPADALSIKQMIGLLAAGACTLYGLEKFIRPKG